MTKTKRFSDIALIGYNPKSGATCFFQNKGPTGQDGARVAHPGDRAKSSTIWPDKPLAYCTDACHTTKAFVHSPWIDQAKRKDGKSIVPKAGEQPDYPLGTKGAFRVLNAEAQGFELKPELVDDKVAACRTCPSRVSMRRSRPSSQGSTSRWPSPEAPRESAATDACTARISTYASRSDSSTGMTRGSKARASATVYSFIVRRRGAAACSLAARSRHFRGRADRSALR
jgi:hypothetical protein